ncbi:hypothetical protein [Pseudoxanthomonas sp.]|uniref:hypothetical protein n=1 Tax=Pseudoxanthomonas sp. TaxID=1871049 RepID=UPI0025F4FE34|nr:hypothetical protein [Pseudoxanthomonas sp.]
MNTSTLTTTTAPLRAHIVKALRKAGRPSFYVTDEHADLFKRAGIDPQYGIRMDTFLRSISWSAAARLLNAIRQIEEPA